MRADVAHRSEFAAWSRSSPAERAKHELSAELNDAVATHAAVRFLGDRCAQVKTVEPCAPPDGLTFLDDPDRALERTRTLLDGLRGDGPCAMKRTNRWDGCFTLQLQLYVGESKLDMVREGARAPLDEHGEPTQYARLAAVEMAWWRAMIDYAVALLPVCSARASASCERLDDGLRSAGPDELARRVLALRAAVESGTPCPSSREVAPDPH